MQFDIVDETSFVDGLIDKGGKVNLQPINDGTYVWRTTGKIEVQPGSILNISGIFTSGDNGYYSMWLYDINGNVLSYVDSIDKSNTKTEQNIVLTLEDNVYFIALFNSNKLYDTVKISVSIDPRSIIDDINDINNELHKHDIDAMEEEIKTKAQLPIGYADIMDDAASSMYAISDMLPWGSNMDSGFDGNDNFYVSMDITTGNKGFKTPTSEITDTSNLQVHMEIEADISNLVVDVIFYFTYINTDGTTKYVALKPANAKVGNSNIIFDLTIDIANYVVYNNLKSWYIIVSACGTMTLTVTDISITIPSDLQSLSIYDTTFEKILVKIQNELNNKSSDTENSDSNDNNIVVSPSGNKFITQVSDTGEIVTTPIYPSEAIFIGNSLITGHGTYGMAATGPDKDYYYLITEYIKQYNADLSSIRVSGSTWEGYTTSADRSTWVTNNVLSKITENTELICIQLGDNVNTDAKKATFAEDSKYFLQQCRIAAPRARVVWMGSWYAHALMDIIKTNCNDTGCLFVDIRDLYADSSNRSSIGTIYNSTSNSTKTYSYDSYTDDADNKMLTITFSVSSVQYTASISYESYTDNAEAKSITVVGKQLIVNTGGAASHPSDLGFIRISNRFLYKTGMALDENTYEAE